MAAVVVEARRVVFIGVGGCSGSGKSSVARRLAAELNSPLIPIQLDWYFKRGAVNDPDRNVIERAAAIEHELLINAVDSLGAALARPTCVALNDPSLTHCQSESCIVCNFNLCISNKRKNRPILRPSRRRREESCGSDPVYVVVEGFLLFMWPELTQRFATRVLVNASATTCCRRRFLRHVGHDAVVKVGLDRRDQARMMDDTAGGSRYSPQVKLDDASIQGFFKGEWSQWYLGVVRVNYEAQWPTQVENASATSGLPEASVVTLDNDTEDAEGLELRVREIAQRCWASSTGTSDRGDAALPTRD